MSLNHSILNIRFLGLGQRVKLQNPNGSDIPIKEDVEEALTDIMKAFFNPGSDTKPLPLTIGFDPAQKWLIGMDMKLLEYLRLATVFQDPHPYGLIIELDKSSGLADVLAGLKFQLGYEKVSDSVGLYKGKVTLPIGMQELDFTTFKLTMPEIYLEIYSNGDFKLDVGFPADLDFSRSLKVEAYPYLGAGGFYLGKYSSATASRTRVPPGEPFSSITEFGFGMQLGTGKEIDKGVLKAGASLTFIGLLEGTLAIYKGNPTTGAGKGKRFYWVKGMLGVGGRVYGSVDLQLVTAKVDAEVKAEAEGIFEAFCPTLLRVKAEIHATGEVTVGYKKFSRKITKEFHDELELDYTIPQKGSPPWSGGCQERRLLQLQLTDIPLNWKPMDKGELKDLLLYVVPHKSLDINGTGEKLIQYAAMTYIDSPSQASKRASEQTGMEVFSEGLLLWAIHAYLRASGDSSTPDELRNAIINREVLKDIQSLLSSSPSDQTMMTYDQISKFMKNYFKVQICDPDGIDCSDDGEARNISYFPMLPVLEMEVTRDVGAPAQILNADFATEPLCSPLYLEKLKERLRATMTRYQTEEERGFDAKRFKIIKKTLLRTPAMAEVFMEDYTVGIIKALVKKSIDALTDDSFLSVKQLWDILRSSDVSGYTAAVSSQYMLFGLRAPHPDAPEETAPVYPIFEVAKQQFTLPPDMGESESIAIVIKPSDSAGDPLTVEFVSCTGSRLPVQELKIELPPDEIKKAIALAELDIKAEDVAVVATALKPFREVHPVYSAKEPVIWKEEDAIQGQLWMLPENWRRRLESASDQSGLVPKKAKKSGTECENLSPDSFLLFTKLELDLKRVLRPGGVAEIYYEIIGTDSQGVILLNHLAQALETSQVSMESIRVLYASGDNLKDLLSDRNAAFTAVQTNLSTWTNPIPQPATLASKESDLKLIEVLLASSLNRSGGNFLRYCSKGGGADPGFPKELFDAQHMGKVTILVLFKKNSRPAPFMNGVFLYSEQSANSETEWIYYEDEKSTIKLPTIPPGHVGLQVVRKNPTIIDPNNPHLKYVLEQFQMMGIQYVNNHSFLEDEVLMPLGPKNQEPQKNCQSAAVLPQDNTLWWYDAVLPIDKNFAPDADPYRAIGNDICLRLQLQDLFGNRLRNRELEWEPPPLSVLYRDMLEPIHQWPGTKASYVLEVSDVGIPSICLTLTFNHDLYTDPDSDQARLAAASYRKIRYQLAHDVRVTVRSSLAINDMNTVGELEELPTAELDEYLCKILNYLNADSDCSGLPVVIPIEFKQCIPVRLVNPHSIFELWVEAVIHRERHVDPDLQLEVDGVTWGLSDILPEALLGTIAGEASGSCMEDIQQTIHVMDQKFQSFFDGSRLAFGRSERLPTIQRSIWVVQIDSKFVIDPQPYLFAMKPMSKCKKSYTFDLNSYPNNDITTITYPGVTLQNWAIDCLKSVQEMLSLPYLDLVQQVEGALDGIQKAKKVIAAALADRLEHVGDVDVAQDRSQIATAKERFKQQLLVNLADAFEIDAVVQHVAGTWGMDTTSSKLYVQVRADEANRSSLSPAKLPLTNGDSSLTYLFTAKKDAQQEMMKYNNLTYGITHVEHQFLPSDPSSGAAANSAWLSLIHPVEGVISDKTEVPVISQIYPETPIILGHDYKLHEPRVDDLKEIRRWKYEMSYRSESPMQAQDRMYVRVNFGDSASGFGLSSEDQLAKAMAQLLFSYYGVPGQEKESIKAVMEEAAVKQERSACYEWHDEKVTQAVTTFCSLVTELSEQWSIQLMASFDGEGSGILLSIHETEEQDSGHLRYKITGGSQDVSVDVKGYTTEELEVGSYKFFRQKRDGTKEYLMFGSPLKDRTLHFDNLDKFSEPQAETTIYMKRNEITFNGEYGPKYKSVKEAFVFQSELAKTTTPVTPLPVGTKRINIATLGTGATSDKKFLADHLDTLMLQLLEGRTRTDHLIRLNANFSFNLLPNMPREWAVKVSHVETASFMYENGGASRAILEEISEDIYAIYRKQDHPYHNFGVLRMELSVYDSQNLTIPILQLKELFLASDNVLPQTGHPPVK